jgi:NADPH2:quinone reductase
MRAVLCKAYGPPEDLELDDVDPPALFPAGVRVRVHAAGVNFPDVLMIKGEYQFKPPFPFSPGAEVAGVVTEVGAEVGGVQVGDRVIAMCGAGGFAEEVVVGASGVLPMPDDMDFVTGAGLTLTYGTSAYALMQRAYLQAGETLLVHGASGGVGLSAVEIGRAMGAMVIGTGGDDEKLKVALDHGCDHVINYRTAEFKDEVKALTDGRGADVIYDAVGGDVFDQSLRCIAWDGRLLVIGFASGRIPAAPANLVLLKSCAVVGVFWGAWSAREPAANRANLDKVVDWWRQGIVRPNVSHTFPLEKASDALYAVINRQVVGKAVVTVS